jgi:hypothetical protein
VLAASTPAWSLLIGQKLSARNSTAAIPKTSIASATGLLMGQKCLSADKCPSGRLAVGNYMSPADPSAAGRKARDHKGRNRSAR